MVENLITLLPYEGLFSHILLAVLILSFIFRDSWGRGIQNFVGKNATTFALMVSIIAVLGSLFYSNIVGFEPCVLCWWQRVFLYPLAVIFAVAMWRKLDSAFYYAVPLASLAMLVALYHSYVDLGGASILPCTAVGAACSKVYVKEFGYITIPSMSLTIAVYILVIAWIKKAYDKNRNA